MSADLRRVSAIASYRMKSALAALAVLTAASAARAQVFPGDLNKTRQVPDSRSQAMGGVRLTLLDDVAGAIFNPALIADAGKWSFSTQGSARNNIPYWDALDFLNDLKKTAGQIRDDPSSVDWDAVGQRLNNLYGHAQEIAGDIVAGKAIQGGISVSPTLGFSYKNVGIVAYGGIAGVAALTPGTGTGPNEDKRTLDASGGFIRLNTILVPYAFRIPHGHLGVSAKYVRAGYTGVSFIADASTRTLTGRSFQDVVDAKPDIDVGYRTDPLPIPGNSEMTWQGAAAIRYLLSPHFDLPAQVNRQSTSGGQSADSRQEEPPLRDFDFGLRPSIDLGGNIAGKISHRTPWRAALEVQNLTATNGGDMSFHGGGEVLPLSWLAVRGGYDASGWVYGLGFKVAQFRIDLAAGTDYRKLISAGVSARF